MAYVVSDDDIYRMHPFMFKDGKNSYFCQLEQEGNLYLLKFFNGTTEEIDEKIKVTKGLCKKDRLGIHAFPIDTIDIYGEEKGYICNYYPDATNFSQKESNLVDYEIKYQATLDTTKQLKLLHKMGFINNDMRLTNNMISEKDQCGFLVDFEDMILEDDFQLKQTYYRFYQKDSYQVLPPSKVEDTKKQFICNLSLLLSKDLENFVITTNEWYLLEQLKGEKPIYKFAKELFRTTEPLYFDQIAPQFRDPEKVKHLSRKIKIY